MRNAMLQALTELAQENQDLMLLTADLGFSVFEEFESRFPKQYINVGVAEQNMTGIAAGLALEGKTVFTYSIGNFPTMRCLEQIRNDVCYHDLNVNIIGMGGGFSYGALGMSHHATEDLAIMRAIPNIEVLAPSSESEAYNLVKQVSSRPKAAYIRLDKTKHDQKGEAEELGKINILMEGNDLLILGIGGVVSECLECAKILRNKGHSASVASVHTLNPFDVSSLIAQSLNKKIIVTVEEGAKYGGLYSTVSEKLIGIDIKAKVIGLGLGDTYFSQVGDQDYLRKQAMIDSTSISTAVLKMLNEK